MDQPVRDFWFFILLLIALWIVWLIGGGPESETARGGPFLRPPAPIDTGETYGGENDSVIREIDQERNTQ